MFLPAPSMGSNYRSPQASIAIDTHKESYRKWSASGVFALVVLVIIAVLFIVAGIAFAKYWFAPKLKRMCIDRCGNAPLKVGDSSEGNHTVAHFDNVEITVEARTPAESLDFSIQVLRDATGNFCDANLLNWGVFGTVYRGSLCNGTTVAVQRLHVFASCIEEMDEFQGRISILSKVRHMHLVTLLGHCIDGSDMLLVYEHVAHLGSLSNHLFAWKELGLTPLSWATRLNIALDVARGLEFLHGMSKAHFIHGCLNASNVLLNEGYRAKVSDYSLLVLKFGFSAKTRLEADISDHMPPEYDVRDLAATGSSVTKKTDVFSFGFLLIELIMGCKVNAQGDKNWAALIKASVGDDEESLEFRSKYADEAMVLVDGERIDGIRTVAKLASCCIKDESADQPKMSCVVNVLSSLVRGLNTSNEETEKEDTDTDGSVFEALKKWQAFEESSMDSETFQVANGQALKSSHPESAKESVSAKDMDSSGLLLHTNQRKPNSSEAEIQSYCQEQIYGPMVG